MNNKKKLKLILIIGIVFILTILGITYAFFTYTRTGENNKLIAGEVYLNYVEENELTLNNAIPETKASALLKTDNVFKFQIEGKNTSTMDIFYDIVITYGDTQTGKTRLKDSDIRIYLEKDGVPVVDGVTYDSWNKRVLYKDKMPALTNNHTVYNYELRIWIDEDVKVSDTDPTADYNTTTWNTSYASMRVNVNSGDAILMPGTMARLGSVADIKFWSDEIENVKGNIKEINFVQLENSAIDTRYNAATIKSDVSTNVEQPIKAWLEVNATDSTKYTMYVASEEKIYFPSDSSYMFGLFSELVTINFDNIDTSQVTNMNCMFAYVQKITSLDLSNFDTRQVGDMNSLFGMCSNLQEIIGLNKLNTSQVTNMAAMFIYCSSLTSLDLSDFDTKKVTNMSGMFSYCSGLTSLDLSSFDTSQVTNMIQMFGGCSSLISLDVSGWNTSQVTNMYAMFAACESLTSLDVSNFDTSQVVDMTYMFNTCGLLSTLNINGFTFNNVTNKQFMFHGTGANLPSGTYTTVYVKADYVLDGTTYSPQTWILNLGTSDRPSGWSTANVLIKQ